MNFDANPTRLVEQRTLEVILISLEREWKSCENWVCVCVCVCVFGGSDQGTASSQFPPHGQDCGYPRSELRLKQTRQFHRCLKKEEATAEPEDPSAELLRRMLAGAREKDVSRVKLARLPAPTGSRGLPPPKAWQDWFTIRLRTWANVSSPEFETELVKKVQGQPADLSWHGAADRQLAHGICFNIDDEMFPYLLALHERCAKPVPCRDKTTLLLTLRRWLTNLKELQAAGSSPSEETVMQSLKTVTGGIRDINNVHEITDLLAPNDPGKLYPAIERKVAGLPRQRGTT